MNNTKRQIEIETFADKFEKRLRNGDVVDVHVFLDEIATKIAAWGRDSKEILQKTLFDTHWEFVLDVVLPNSSDEMPKQTKEINKRTIGGYVFLKKEGGGGYGYVYRVQRVSDKQTFAIKVINAEKAKDPVSVSRFKKELDFLKTLRHKSIVNVHELISQDVIGRLSLVMDFIEGVNLQSFVQPGRRMPLHQALDAIRQVAVGMDYAQRQSARGKSIIHRDIKPSNIMLDDENNAIILDFGLAKLRSDYLSVSGQNTESDMTLGTKGYVAPELLGNSDKANIQSDIFSLGCTFYAIVVGRHPEPSYTDHRLSFIQNNIPANSEVENLLQYMSAMECSRRYKTMEEVINNITRCLNVQMLPPPPDRMHIIESSPPKTDSKMQNISQTQSREDRCRDFAGLCSSERDYLRFLVREHRPKKVLEIGVGAGSSAAILLDATKELGSAVFSIDYQKKFYRNNQMIKKGKLKKEEDTGFLIEEYPEFKGRWKLYADGLAYKHMNKIGKNIDFCLIDTVHVMPGEILDYLMVLPYLKNGCVVLLHDVNLPTANSRENDFASTLLISAIQGKKLFMNDDYKASDRLDDAIVHHSDTHSSNIAGVIITKETRKHVWEIFNLLILKWKYVLQEDEARDIKKYFKEHYPKMSSLFSDTVDLQEKRGVEKTLSEIIAEKEIT